MAAVKALKILLFCCPCEIRHFFEDSEFTKQTVGAQYHLQNSVSFSQKVTEFWITRYYINPKAH
jgi:hypothetical protein